MAHEARLTHREELSEGILVVRFTRPEGYVYKAGQWCFLDLPNLGRNDDRGLRRHLSICSAPEEEGITFATKMSDSAFKQTLSRLEPGQPIYLDDPKGRLALPGETNLPVCFLAGGIGITPFRSLSFHSSLAKSGHNITLLYSSRTPEETPFLEEFERLDKEKGSFRFVATMTRMPQSKRTWSGREGRMNAQMIKEEFPAWNQGVFYIAGPPKMVETMVDMMCELDIPEDRLHIEKFMGY